MNMLSTHFTFTKSNAEVGINSGYIPGTCFSISLTLILNPQTCWVVDTGSTIHICYNQLAFHTVKPIQNAYITLLNHERLHVYFNGTVKINPKLVIEDVLFVSQFKFNLLSISSITRNSSVKYQFFIDFCIIQDLNSLSMIGKGKRTANLYKLDAASPNSVQNCSISHSVCSTVNNVTTHTCITGLVTCLSRS